MISEWIMLEEEHGIMVPIIDCKPPQRYGMEIYNLWVDHIYKHVEGRVWGTRVEVTADHTTICSSNSQIDHGFHILHYKN